MLWYDTKVFDKGGKGFVKISMNSTIVVIKPRNYVSVFFFVGMQDEENDGGPEQN